jgi:leucyl aminopeptidase
MPTLSAAVPKKPDLTVILAGRSAPGVPAIVARLAASAGKDGPAQDSVVTEHGRFAILKVEEKPWLTGGEAWRILGGKVVDAARHAKAATVVIIAELDAAEAQALAEGLLLGDYRYLAFRSGKEAKRAPLAIHLPGQAAAIAAATIVAAAQNLARDLSDAPPNVLTPASFAERAKRELKGLGVDVRVIGGTEKLRKAGFPGLAQVGQAGITEPQLVEIRWRPGGIAKRGGKHLALVGKGMTFDSGGISLKPGDKMWEMKADMAGAAAVLGAMTAIAKAKPPFAVTGYLALAENMPDTYAQRPGDIYKARNGLSIHVDNTDAEGRLILADVLTYAAEQGATHMVDVATLTGACLVALGDKVAGLLGRAQHQAWIDRVRAAGQAVGEELWQLPLHGEYRSMLDHPHADINNIGGRFGGAITAGVFLSEFVPENVAWAHLDIAGPAIQTGGWKYYAKGMTGFATRTLIRLAADLR